MYNRIDFNRHTQVVMMPKTSASGSMFNVIFYGLDSADLIHDQINIRQYLDNKYPSHYSPYFQRLRKAFRHD